MNIEQIAQEVAQEMGRDEFTGDALAKFLRRCLSKLAEQAGGPVAYAWDCESAGLTYENHYSDTTPLYTEAQLAASQLREQQLREALHKLACLGNGAHYGTSDGNRIAQVALALPADTSALDRIKAGYEAQIQQLRDALKEIKGSGYTNLSPRCHMLMGAALSETQDTAAIDRIKAVYEAHQNKMQDEIEALRKEVGRLLATGIGQIMSDAAAKAGEVMRERCLDKTPDPHDRNRIRALPGVTMEDLK